MRCFLVFVIVSVSCGFFMLTSLELVKVRSLIASGKVLSHIVFFISFFFCFLVSSHIFHLSLKIRGLLLLSIFLYIVRLMGRSKGTGGVDDFEHFLQQAEDG